MLNKLFLAVIIALLITAITEAVYLFVYKEPQKIEEEKIVFETPSSSPAPIKNPAVNSSFIDYFKTLPPFDNEKNIYTSQVTGKISSITINPNEAKPIRIGLEGTSMNIFIEKTEIPKLKIYSVEKNGVQTPIDASALTVGENIVWTVNFDMNQYIDNSLIDMSIIKIK